MTNTNFEGALSWDSEIKQESSFNLLPAGEYQFEVEKMERGQYQPSPKSSIRDVSPQAELHIKIFGGEHGNTNVIERLILHTKTEFKISEFFIAIGQKQPGQPLTPNWNYVIGSTGRCEIEVNKYNNSNGQERENNRVVRFLEPEQGGQPQQSQWTQPTKQAPTQQQSQQGGWTPQAQPTQTTQQPQAPSGNNPGFNF
ncbi:hypothetical protein [Aerococcus viridans]|uniref:hypothetical protein n=1 Tax=Aerococcus viridans TaxID=1377 RepID=UPI00223B18E3|nr:hypothetical protein [Aerococcus viridans]MCT1797403.1 hypothetical protein [Aerococcus viridans]